MRMAFHYFPREPLVYIKQTTFYTMEMLNNELHVYLYYDDSNPDLDAFQIALMIIILEEIDKLLDEPNSNLFGKRVHIHRDVFNSIYGKYKMFIKYMDAAALFQNENHIPPRFYITHRLRNI